MPGNIVLIGFSGSGKTSVGQALARRLGWAFIDTDDAIVAADGRPIPRIFREDGEARFRELERAAVARCCAATCTVISTGGGAPVDPRNRALLREGNHVVWLDAPPETLHARLMADRGGPERPLLQADDPLRRICELLELRLPIYRATATLIIPTDGLTPEQVADRILQELGMAEPFSLAASLHSPPEAIEPSIHPLVAGMDCLALLGEHMGRLGLRGRAFVVTDSNVAPHHAGPACHALAQAGFTTALYVLPAGEESKSLDAAIRLYGWLAEQRAERRDCIVALGGGVVGDTAGFVAATYLRGMPLVQVPTTLLAMVDSAIGGKVAVNLPQGKNLVGAFYQPRLTFIDTALARTLPRREQASGWAEVIKTAIIFDDALVRRLEVLPGLDTSPQDFLEIVRACATRKARLVVEDERDQGRRAVLNYGHTIGHALEAATGYGRLLHGEAVAVGMSGEVRIAQRIGLLEEPDLVERQDALLRRFELPLACPGVAPNAILRAMTFDKKAVGARLRWVLPRGSGRMEYGIEVPDDIVTQVVKTLVGEG